MFFDILEIDASPCSGQYNHVILDSVKLHPFLLQYREAMSSVIPGSKRDVRHQVFWQQTATKISSKDILRHFLTSFPPPKLGTQKANQRDPQLCDCLSSLSGINELFYQTDFLNQREKEKEWTLGRNKFVVPFHETFSLYLSAQSQRDGFDILLCPLVRVLHARVSKEPYYPGQTLYLKKHFFQQP